MYKQGRTPTYLKPDFSIFSGDSAVSTIVIPLHTRPHASPFSAPSIWCEHNTSGWLRDLNGRRPAFRGLANITSSENSFLIGRNLDEKLKREWTFLSIFVRNQIVHLKRGVEIPEAWWGYFMNWELVYILCLSNCQFLSGWSCSIYIHTMLNFITKLNKIEKNPWFIK